MSRLIERLVKGEISLKGFKEFCGEEDLSEFWGLYIMKELELDQDFNSLERKAEFLDHVESVMKHSGYFTILVETLRFALWMGKEARFDYLVDTLQSRTLEQEAFDESYRKFVLETHGINIGKKK